MIRLAVFGRDHATWSDVAPRLRGALIEDICSHPADARIHSSDAIVLTSPAQPCAEYVKKWLAQRKHVLLAADACLPDELEALATFKTDHGSGQLAIVNPDCCLPSRMTIRQELAAGHFGEVGLVRLHRWESGTPESSTSALPGPLVRDLELTCWLLGCSPNTVYAVERSAQQREGHMSRILQAHLGFGQGGMALIDYASALPAGDGYQSLSVIGSTGAAYADDHQNVQLLYGGGRPQATRTDEGSGHIALMVQEFVNKIQTGRDLSASTNRWREILRIARAAQRSIETSQAVVVEE